MQAENVGAGDVTLMAQPSSSKSMVHPPHQPVYTDAQLSSALFNMLHDAAGRARHAAPS